MDERRERVRDDLADLLQGDLFTSWPTCSAYSIDASLFEIEPLAVAQPRSTSDVARLVRYCVENSITIHPRGAGTGVSGGCLGPGLVVDLSRSLNRMIGLGPDWVDVEAGATIASINEELARVGRRLPWETLEPDIVTIGGVLSENDSGRSALEGRSPADWVDRLTVVTSDGESASLGWTSLEPTGIPVLDRIVPRLVALLDWHAEIINQEASRLNAMGPCLAGVRQAESLQLARLFCGAQGTLGIMTEARVRTLPLSTHRATLVASFEAWPHAIDCLADCLPLRPEASEFYDWRATRILREVSIPFAGWIDEDAQAALILQVEAPDGAALLDRVVSLRAILDRSPGRPRVTQLSRRTDLTEAAGLAGRIDRVSLAVRGTERPTPVLDRVTIPPSRLSAFLHAVQAWLNTQGRHAQITASGTAGWVQIRPYLSLAETRDVTLLQSYATQLAGLAAEHGGFVRGIHGRGLLPQAVVRESQGHLAPLLVELQAVFDPRDLFNPGLIVGQDPAGNPRPLRQLASPGPRGRLPILDQDLLWPEGGPSEIAASCTGCGVCRTDSNLQRMCPSFRALGTEESSPRGRAHLLRQIAAGRLDPNSLGSDAMKEVADLCLHCHLCRLDCPAGVDVSSLMLEAKAAHVEAHGIEPADWLLARIESWSWLASRFPRMFNRTMESTRSRWLLEKLTGLSRLRCLPRAPGRSFLERAERQGLTRPSGAPGDLKAVYFVDVFANYFDVELAESVVAVLRHAGVDVFVPKRQRGCGMPALVSGDLDTAREQAAANLRVLGEAVRDGYTVVCSEPTAALMLRREYLRLTDDLDAEFVARHTVDAGEYLARLVAEGRVPPPSQAIHARVGYHQPCHIRAMEIGTPGLDLLRTVPGLDVEFIDRGCSGIAGIFGLSRKNFVTSLRAGRKLMSRLGADDIQLGSTECSACRMQMEQGSTKSTFHPMKLLGMAYGVSTIPRTRLTQPKPRHIIS